MGIFDKSFTGSSWSPDIGVDMRIDLNKSWDSISGLFKKDKGMTDAEKNNLANVKGTGILQSRIDDVFKNPENFLRPQTEFQVGLLRNNASRQMSELGTQFDKLRSNVGEGRSGFVDLARQRAEMQLSDSFYENMLRIESSFADKVSQFKTQGAQMELANKKALYDIWGSKAGEMLGGQNG